ncbi:MAG: HEPN domain-containing protein [Myxococcota bacterium]
MADELRARVAAAFPRARDKLRAARQVLAAGLPAEAVGPAYYAAFRAAETALWIEGDEPRTHEGLKSLFGLRFVRTGRLPPNLASILRELKDERENGDYSVFPAVTEEDAKEAIASAERFVDAVEAFVRGQGFETR